MKPTIALKSLNDLSLDLADLELDQPAQTLAESIPAGLREPQRVTLYVQEANYTCFETYHHWGINE